MTNVTFNSFDEFFNYFKLSKNSTIRFSSGDFAYFEFQPYKGDKTIIRGWIEGFDRNEVTVSFKYNEFDLGVSTWDIDKAKRYIGQIDYFSDDIDE